MRVNTSLYRPRPALFPTLILCLCACSLAVMRTAHAQILSGNPNNGRVVTPGARPTPMDIGGPRPDSPEMLERQERGRNTDRKKRIVEDTNRLLQLTVQFRAEAQGHETLTVDDQKKLDEIAKLAHQVRDRMRQ